MPPNEQNEENAASIVNVQSVTPPLHNFRAAMYSFDVSLFFATINSLITELYRHPRREVLVAIVIANITFQVIGGFISILHKISRERATPYMYAITAASYFVAFIIPILTIPTVSIDIAVHVMSV